MANNVFDGMALAGELSAPAGVASLCAETAGDPRISIAILDGPVDLTHPCLKGANLTVVESLISCAVDQGIASQHGTHIASVIFGQPGTAVRGIAPDCHGIIIPVFESGEEERLHPCSQVDLARAITLAVQHGAQIINISAGQLDASGEAHPLLASAVRLCASNDVLIVAAAGNDGCECLHIPAAEPSVLVVGAMDSSGSPMNFSNWGEQYQAKGILAPGQDILGAAIGGGTALRSGTSFATPFASAAVALLLSIQIKRGEKPDPFAARNAILDSAIGCDQQPVPNCSRLLAGRLNVVGALTHLTKGGYVEMSEHLIESPDLNRGAEQFAGGVEPKAPAIMPPAFAQSAAGVMASESQPVAMKSGQAPSSYAPGNIMPSGGGGGCGCGGSSGGGCSCGGPAPAPVSGPALVYALGQLGFDFGTEARRDSFSQQAGANVSDPAQLLAYLDENPWDAAYVQWTLNQDSTPIYVIKPSGPFAEVAYERLRQFLAEQINEGVERISVPGFLGGKTQLLNGQIVPTILPAIRGMYSWTTSALVSALLGAAPKKKEGHAEHEARSGAILNFLERVYYELRNLGVAPQERAMNFAATNAFQVENVFRSAIEADMSLDSIDVERSPICRPGSDCWDVKLTFFNPTRRLDQARRIYRFTVDVSDVVPVTVGRVRNWHVY